jgi:hypothetical protein
MWLSAEERALAEYRLALEADGEEDTVKGSVLIGLKDALIDPKVWLLVLIQTCAVIGMSFTVGLLMLQPASGANCYSTSSRRLFRLWGSLESSPYC